MTDLDTADVMTLFTFRYLLDKPNDIVDLTQDVLDLQAFPERLFGSYKEEWTRYIKRELATKQTSKNLIHLDIKEVLSSDSLEEYESLKQIVSMALSIEATEKVIVIDTPLKAYLNQLMKL
ncbi:MAG: hypothetical protein AAGJ37_13825 [Pseudomonadota bacterium]